MRPFFYTCFEVIKLLGADVKALAFDCMQEIFMYNEPNLRRYMTLRRRAKLPVIGTEGVHPLRMRALPTRFFDNNVFQFFSFIDHSFVVFRNKSYKSGRNMTVLFSVRI